MLRSALGVALVIGIAACSPIEKYETLQQPQGQTLRAGPGDVIAKIVKERDLENIWGKADMYGRRTAEGFAELRYLGLRGGKLLFERRDVTIESNETTMSRTGGMYIPETKTTTTTGMVGGAPVHGTSTTQGGGTVVPGPDSDAIAIPSGATRFTVPAKDPHSIAFHGRTIRILSVAPGSIGYVIEGSPRS